MFLETEIILKLGVLNEVLVMCVAVAYTKV